VHDVQDVEHAVRLHASPHPVEDVDLVGMTAAMALGVKGQAPDGPVGGFRLLHDLWDNWLADSRRYWTAASSVVSAPAGTLTVTYPGRASVNFEPHAMRRARYKSKETCCHGWNGSVRTA